MIWYLVVSVMCYCALGSQDKTLILRKFETKEQCEAVQRTMPTTDCVAMQARGNG